MSQQCTRFHRDGTRCQQMTDAADGWCRTEGCPGYTRAAESSAPVIAGKYLGGRAHRAASGDVTLDIDSDEAYEIALSQAAVDAFRFHHGGSETAARAQLRSMLEDFTRNSARRRDDAGFWQLAHSGYSLVLDAQSTVVVGYRTVHRERTWAQVKAGVPSRFGQGKPSNLPDAGPRPEPGPEVPSAELPIHVSTVYPTKLALKRYLALTRTAPDEELIDRLREDCGTAVRDGRVERVPQADGTMPPMHLVRHAGFRWLLTPDARVLVSVAADDAR